MPDTKQKELIKRILGQLSGINSIYGYCARMCQTDTTIAHEFILECAKRCNDEFERLIFGEDLANALLEYKNEFGRMAP